MPTWAVLLRGINVGGHNKLPMAELRAALTDAGFADVATYIASGNIVLDGESCQPEQINAIILDRFGIDVSVMVRSAEQIQAVAAANPFPEQAVADPKSVHCFFTSRPLADDGLADFDHQRFEPDRVIAAAGELYAHYPNGMAQSKLTNAVLDRAAGGPVTARSWNTVVKLTEMVERDGEPVAADGD